MTLEPGPARPVPFMRRTRMARTAMTVAAIVMTAKPNRPVKISPVLARALNTAAKVRAAWARSPGGTVTRKRTPATMRTSAPPASARYHSMSQRSCSSSLTAPDERSLRARTAAMPPAA